MRKSGRSGFQMPNGIMTKISKIAAKNQKKAVRNFPASLACFFALMLPICAILTPIIMPVMCSTPQKRSSRSFIAPFMSVRIAAIIGLTPLYKIKPITN